MNKIIECCLRLNENKYGIAAIIGGFFIHLTLGNIYSFGNMMTYMDSYMHLRVSKYVTYSNFIWVNSVTTITQGLFMAIGGVLEKKIGVRLTCLIGSILLSSGIALTYFSIKTSFAAVIVTYGFLSGLGISISYIVPLSCGMKWFPDKKGFVSGIIVGGFGLGALGSTALQTHFLNPDNIPVDSSGYFENASILDKVPDVFVLLGGVFFTLQTVGCILLSKKEETVSSIGEIESERLLEDDDGDKSMPQNQTDAMENLHVTFQNTDPRIMKRDLNVKEALRTKPFYILFFIYVFNSIAVSYINAMYKSFGQTFIKNDFFLAEVGSIAAIFNFGGRIAWGKLMDRTTFRFSMMLMTLLLSAFYASLPLTAVLGSASFAIWIWCIFFCFSGTFVLISTATEKAFGSSSYSTIYGLLFTNQIISSIVVSILNESLLTRIGYSGCFFTVAVVVTASALLAFTLPKNL